MLNVHSRHVATQLREWSLLGFFTHTGLGTYRLNTPTPPPSSTTRPGPYYAALLRDGRKSPALTPGIPADPVGLA
jgi:hypothetical protein